MGPEVVGWGSLLHGVVLGPLSLVTSDVLVQTPEGDSQGVGERGDPVAQGSGPFGHQCRSGLISRDEGAAVPGRLPIGVLFPLFRPVGG